MVTCQVLHCTNEASKTYVVAAPGVDLIELDVCTGHLGQLADGAAWNLDLDIEDRALLMGDDAVPRIATWETIDGIGTSEVGPGFVWKLHLSRNGEVFDVWSIWVTYENAAALGPWLSQLGKLAR